LSEFRQASSEHTKRRQRPPFVQHLPGPHGVSGSSDGQQWDHGEQRSQRVLSHHKGYDTRERAGH
jgi:hypothetical protein